MLHPQAGRLLQLIEQSGVPPVHQLTPEEARRAYRERRFFTQPDAPATASVQDLQAQGASGTIALRLYRPLASVDAATLPVVVYFHGGGFVLGDLDTHDVLCRELANASGCAVISVDYRLAPEHPFPAAVDDCMAATDWVRRHASSLAIDPARLAVAGDSAGGTLAAVVSIAARDRADDPPIRFQLLIYPGTDVRCTAASHTTNGAGYLLTRESIGYFVRHYISDPAHLLDWRASPLLREDLAGLPPALVLTAGYDPLRDEGLAYAQRLSDAGNRATLVCFDRQIHGFITMARIIDEADAAVALCASELRRALK